jgi:diguanylate cyclase (GGDEF)-like protein
MWAQLYSILLGVSLVLQAILAAVVLIRNPRHPFNQVFFAGVAASWLWCLTFFVRYGVIGQHLLHGEADFLLWAKISHVAGILIFSFVSYFFIIFPDRRHNLPRRAFALAHLGLVPAAMVALVLTNQLVSGMQRVGSTYLIVPGPLHLVWVLFTLGCFTVGGRAVVKKYRRVLGLGRLQLQYVIAGLAATMVLGMITNILVPALAAHVPGMTDARMVALLGPLTVLVYLVSTTIAMVRHRLMEIERVIVRSLAYFGASLLMIGGYAIVVVISERQLRSYVGQAPHTSALLSAVAAALLFSPVKNRLHSALYEGLFSSTFEYQTALRESAQAIVTKLNLEAMAVFLVESVQRHLGSQQVALLLRSERGPSDALSLVAQRGMDPDEQQRFHVGAEFLAWLEQRRTVLVKEEAEMDAQGSHGLPLGRLGAAVLVPIFSRNHLEGVIALDQKRSGRSYSPSDIELLTLIAAQAAVAVLNARLYDQAITDGLTGLFNRRYFDQRLVEEVARAQRTSSAIALLMVDIDHFKVVNDTYGHPCGDDVLVQVAQIVRDSVRTSDVVCRYGGEEIAVVLPESTTRPLLQGAEVGQRVAERMRAAVAGHVFRSAEKDLPVRVTISIGVGSSVDVQELSAHDLLALADQALYAAKDAGRDRVVVMTSRGAVGADDSHPAE